MDLVGLRCDGDHRGDSSIKIIHCQKLKDMFRNVCHPEVKKMSLCPFSVGE